MRVVVSAHKTKMHFRELQTDPMVSLITYILHSTPENIWRLCVILTKATGFEMYVGFASILQEGMTFFCDM